MSDDPAHRPVIHIKPGHHRRARAGAPWVYSNEVIMDGPAGALAPGALVTLMAADKAPVGVATFNPHCLIAARILCRDPAQAIDTAFLATRVRRALALRERLYPAPYYRLVHAESDGLGGVVIDRYGDALVVQINTAGMESLSAPLTAAVEDVLRPARIIVRRDAGARALEGLDAAPVETGGSGSPILELPEGGVRFLVDPVAGQKTGWFYDQAESRTFTARLARGGRVLDLYCYVGGFALTALAAGAREAVGIDRSEDALALARRTAAASGMAERCAFRRAEVFAELATLAAARERFDVVIADPPAFVRSRRQANVGLRGYRKLVRLAAPLVAAGGFLFVASCSHNVSEEQFAEQVRQGLRQAGRSGQILRRAGAGPDHPVDPQLPESAYLKSAVLALD